MADQTNNKDQQQLYDIMARLSQNKATADLVVKGKDGEPELLQPKEQPKDQPWQNVNPRSILNRRGF